MGGRHQRECAECVGETTAADWSHKRIIVKSVYCKQMYLKGGKSERGVRW